MNLSRQMCLAVVMLALSGGLPLPAAAGGPGLEGGLAGGAGLCKLALDLSAFVADETGMAALRACPVIGVGLPSGAGVARSQGGAFDPATGRIDLAPDLNLMTAYGRSYLVHELVHEAQYRTGRAAQAPCPSALEAEAYAVQARFLRVQGEDEAAGTVLALGALLGQCQEAG